MNRRAHAILRWAATAPPWARGNMVITGRENRVAMRRRMEGWFQRRGGSAQLERAIPGSLDIHGPWTTDLRYPVDGARMAALVLPIDQLLALE